MLTTVARPLTTFPNEDTFGSVRCGEGAGSWAIEVGRSDLVSTEVCVSFVGTALADGIEAVFAAGVRGKDR